MDKVYLQELIRRREGESREMYKQPDRKVYKQAKVRLAAYHHELDEFLSEHELELARGKGILPSDRFNIHHIIPLWSENSTYDCGNLAIMTIQAHDWFHKCVYNPVLSKMQHQDVVHILLPTNFNKGVITMDSIDPEYRRFHELNARGYYSKRGCHFFNIEHPMGSTR